MLTIAIRVLVVSLALAASTSFAQNWPGRPVKILIGYGAGGATDIIARLLAEDMGKRLGQPFIVENRVGAGGLIAATAVKNSTPDGYTLFGGAVTAFTPVFMKANNMNAAKELQPVSMIALGDEFLMVRSNLGVGSLSELVAKAKATRLKHAATATTETMLMAVLAKQLGFEYDNIPYKTTDQAITGLLAGDTDFMLNSLPGSTPHISSGKLRVLATIAPVRSPLMPAVPTAKELGANFERRFSLGIWAPLGTPRDVVAKLAATVTEAVKSTAVSEKISSISMIPSGSSPDELLRMFQTEMRIFEEAAAITGIQPE